MDRAAKIADKQDRFEFGVVKWLKREHSGDLYILSDFYFLCCDLLELDDQTSDYDSSKRKIQYRLNKMKKSFLIRSYRMGTGWCGKTDFGMTSLNAYSLK
jgi:hypothetical protein